MVEILSRRDGERPKDARLRSLLRENRATITRLADHISNGAFSASKAQQAVAPQAPAGPKLYALGAAVASKKPVCPVVRATINGRVIVVDYESGRQLDFLGEIRRKSGAVWFVLATAENRFPAPISSEFAARLGDLDAAELAADGGEDALVAEIARRLGVEAL